MFHHVLLGKEQNPKIILDFLVLVLEMVLICHLVSGHFHLHSLHLLLILEKHDQVQVFFLYKLILYVMLSNKIEFNYAFLYSC